MTAGSITLNSGSGGENVATDETGGVAYQRVKLVDGAIDGTDAIGGDATNGLDVDVTRVGGTVTVDNAGTFAVQVDGAALTALQVIDNAVHADDSAFTLGTDSGMMMMGFAGTQSVNANDAAALACDTDGALHIADGGNSITVDNGGTFVTQVDGDALTALQTIDNVVHVDDAAFTLGTDSGVMMMGFAGTQSVNANDAAALACDTDGALHISDGGNTITVDGTVTADLGATDNAVLDQIEVNTSYGDNTGGGTEAGALRVTLANNSTGVLSVDDNGGSLTVDNAGLTELAAAINANELDVNLASSGATVTVDLGANNDIQGDVANDAADSGNPVKIGAHATNSIEAETQVVNNDRVDIKADLNGVILTRPHTTLEEGLSERYICSTSASTALSNFDAGGGGIHNYITTISIANGTGTQAIVDISDASASAAGIMWTLVCPSSGGNNVTFDPPLKQPTANTAIHVKADVSVDAIYVSLNGFQAQG